ncbi:PREDICTED: uncharacterized protein LOC104612334 [Nelumbo nucifera]|uniref:Uncharacterized protein LOC104612334 n=1 Tax=Nelumbo nucifera TaxID=4432 RepID=A0A1U8BLZ3_NELNU|nr:PREDICTED: uncharacterized protein LOC104612334 [Nelumbo nucifera]
MEKRAVLGVKKKPIKQTKRRFLKKVVDYLKSDSYMYAPLISPPPPSNSPARHITSSSDSRPLSCLTGVTTAVSTRKVNNKNNQTNDEPENMLGEEQDIEGSHPQPGNLGPGISGHFEMVKHIVHKNCRPSSLFGHDVQNIKRCTTTLPTVKT